jgi:hypothetical protein
MTYIYMGFASNGITISDFWLILYSWWCRYVTSISLMLVSVVCLRLLLAMYRVRCVASALVLLVKHSTDTAFTLHLRQNSDK